MAAEQYINTVPMGVIAQGAGRAGRISSIAPEHTKVLKASFKRGKGIDRDKIERIMQGFR